MAVRVRNRHLQEVTFRRAGPAGQSQATAATVGTMCRLGVAAREHRLSGSLPSVSRQRFPPPTTMPRPTAVLVRSSLPPQFPTHRHAPEFWEHLGRAIAAFGFLEETLGKAIFAFTATTEYSEEEVQSVLAKWPAVLNNALTDSLYPLAEVYGKAVRDHHAADFAEVGDLVEAIKQAAKVRNAISHGSWRAPDPSGKSALHFINKQIEIFDALIDIEWLRQLQAHVQELICSVIDSVTVMGWKFPGSAGPGQEIWSSQTD